MYQFIHIESYSKVSAKKKLNYNNETKGRNVSDIIGEATRKRGYCDHVEEPEEPIILYGVDPNQIEVLTEDYFNNTKLTNSKGVTRGLRKDSHILLAGVISLNAELKDEIWDEYKKDAIKWLREKYGGNLKCVVEHTDEEHPHIHFYCVQENGKDFNLLHEGKSAFVKEKLKYKKEIAFKNAMRNFQEDFYNSVSLKYGLMKTGPRRQRLSNEDYKRQQQEIKLINLYKNKTNEEVELLISNAEKEIKEQKAKAKSEIDFLKKQELAAATKVGEKRGFQEAIKTFESKNVFNKFVFSKTFSQNQITLLEKRNAALLNKNKKLFLRKELYKKQSEENSGYKNKFNYLKEVTQFINDFDFKENKDERRNDDVRREIAAEIKRIEVQQQQIHTRTETARVRLGNARRKTESFGERIRRTTGVLFTSIIDFTRHFSRAATCKQEKLKINNYENSIEKRPEQTEQRTNTSRRNFKM